MKYKIIFDVKQEDGTSIRYAVLSVKHYKDGTISYVTYTYGSDPYLYTCDNIAEAEAIKEYILNRSINVKGFHNLILDSITIIPIID